MTQTIEIIISPTAEATVQTKGFAGASCHAASRFIEQALGKVQSDKATTEMYQATVLPQHVHGG